MGGSENNFDKQKIYENLHYVSEPSNYNGSLPWVVQQQIAATNGLHYVDLIGKLSQYPQYSLPVRNVSHGLMLDIGNGWGRWLVAGNKKGYIPIGIDIRHEFCKAAIQTLHLNNCLGYSIVADLRNLPFKDNIFDFIWSFSVIQHTHKSKMLSCLENINRVLKFNCFCKLEFPNKYGIHNYFFNIKRAMQSSTDVNSWNVRYYSISEYKKIFFSIFGNFRFKNHSFFGIGILKEDLLYVSFKNKLVVIVSLVFSFFTLIFSFLKYFSDSIYIQANKNSNVSGFTNNELSIKAFLHNHKCDPKNNLNILPLLRCPITEEDLMVSDDKSYIFSTKSFIKYPLIDNIPVLIKSEAF